MKTITKTIEAYEYNELPEDVKEKIRMNNGIHDADSETDSLNDYFLENIKERAPYLSDVRFAWSCSSCQGAGLSFSAQVSTIDLLHAAGITKDSIVNAINDSTRFIVYGNKGRYTFAHADQVDIETTIYDKKHMRISRAIDKALDFLRSEYLDICADYFKQARATYDNLYSDEYARDLAEANEFLYDIKGNIVA